MRIRYISCSALADPIFLSYLSARCAFTAAKCNFCAQVLMRALRDFNLPKIVTSDVPIFLGLISDLFPQLDVPRKRDPELEAAVRQSVTELHLQPEENFMLKVPLFLKIFLDSQLPI